MKYTYLLISIVFSLLGLILSHTYRPYIYENNIFDFHIADTIGNLVAIPAYVCAYYALAKKPRKLEYVVLSGIVTFILFEGMGAIKLHGVFDWYDIIATFVSGFITYFILKILTIKEK